MRRTRGCLGNTPFFWQFVKSALDASFAPVMLDMDVPVRRIHTPNGRHSLPPIFLSAFEAFVLLVCWRQPAWRVVLFCSGVGGLTLA